MEIISVLLHYRARSSRAEMHCFFKFDDLALNAAKDAFYSQLWWGKVWDNRLNKICTQIKPKCYGPKFET